MMQAIGYIAYETGMFLYRMLLQLAYYNNTKAKQMIDGRKDLLKKIATDLSNEKRKRIWYHCASLGEFEQIRPLLDRKKKSHPELAIVVSFFSPSGYEQRKLYSNADYVYYLPFDSAGNAKSFVESVQPIEVYFAKYDIWNHYLKVLSERNIPTYLVAANFRKGQIYFRWYGLFFKNMLKRFTHIYSQFEASTQLLKNNGIITSSTAGDTRYDRVMELANETVKLPLIAAFIENHRMMVIGSSYEAEEELTKQSEYKNYKLKLIVVPHDIDQHQIDATEKRFGASDSIRFSKADPESIKDKMILIVDNVGMLGRIYQYADIAIIGGGFGKKGIHNILEPLAHGVPVVIGSENHQKYPETLLAKESGVLFSVASSSEFNEVLKLVFSTEASGGYWKEKCKGFIRNHSGVTDSISREIEMKNYK